MKETRQQICIWPFYGSLLKFFSSKNCAFAIVFCSVIVDIVALTYSHRISATSGKTKQIYFAYLIINFNEWIQISVCCHPSLVSPCMCLEITCSVSLCRYIILDQSGQRVFILLQRCLSETHAAVNDLVVSLFVTDQLWPSFGDFLSSFINTCTRDLPATEHQNLLILDDY